MAPPSRPPMGRPWPGRPTPRKPGLMDTLLQPFKQSNKKGAKGKGNDATGDGVKRNEGKGSNASAGGAKR